MLDTHPLLLAAELRADSHTPPADWDYGTPWRCQRAGCDVEFASYAAFREARRGFLKVKADKSDIGKKTATARAKRYAELHPSQQGEFEPPCTDLDMIDILLDPLHCLLLNLPKVVWKYVFGDRMTNEQRELVAEYASPRPVICSTTPHRWQRSPTLPYPPSPPLRPSPPLPTPPIPSPSLPSPPLPSPPLL
jgi:hypothetical protein